MGIINIHKHNSMYNKKLTNQYSLNKEVRVAFPPMPRVMMIEVTNNCNFKCVYCYNKHMKRERGHIDSKLCIKIIGEALAWGVTDIGFHSTGEAMLDDNLYGYIWYAKKMGCGYTYLTTNGSLLTEEIIRNLGNVLDSINISAHGRDVSEIESLAKKYIKNVVVTNVSDPRNQGGYMPMYPNSEILKRDGCMMPFNRLHVTKEGYLTICCVDFENRLVYADLNKTSLWEAWQGKEAENYRKGHIGMADLPEQCKKCFG